MKENSIEEDIKILKSIIKINNDYLKGVENQTINQKEIKAIEHILSDYKRVLKENEELLEVKVSASAHNRILELEKENEELEEINNELEAEKNEAIRRYNFETIPIKKIKDKIEELNKEIKSCTEIDAIFKIKKQQILQELLGDK